MNQPFDFFNYSHGILSADQINIPTLIHEVGTPAYIYSKTAILSRLKVLQDGLKGLDYLICFAVKSNSNLSILKLLSQQHVGAEIVSGGELFRAHSANIPGHQIVFSGVGKTETEIKKALHYNGTGIYAFNVESIPELFTLNTIAMELNRHVPIALRLNPDIHPKTHPYISTGMKKNKFGLNSVEILKIVHQLNDFPYLQLRGISMHIGSQILSLNPLQEAFHVLYALIQKIPFALQFVNLGGGIGITYSDEQPFQIEQYCTCIHQIFGSAIQGQKLKILIEPGRYLMGNSGILVTQILYRKERKMQDFLIVDAAMNDLIRPALYGSYHQIIPVKEKFRNDPLKKTTIVGPICESSDFLGKSRKLSIHLQKSDLLAILSAGAYGFTLSSQYNSRPRAVEVLVQDQNFFVIRKRETETHLILGEEMHAKI